MQKFKFPMEYLRVTQGELDSYSHAGSLAMDFGGKDGGADKLYCPCDMVVKRCRHNANGELYLESTLPVEFADGTADYARLICLHDNAFNVTEGQVLLQGDYFYDEGGMGAGKPGKFANHVHIEAGKGKWKSCTQSTNAQGTYVIENQSHLYDLFILGDDVEILDGGGYDWKRVGDVAKQPVKPNNSVVYGVDASHHQSDTCIDEIAAGGKADFVILRATIGSYTVDKKLDTFAKAVQRHGFKNSYYCASYAAAAHEAAEEADFICSKCKEYGNEPELAIFFDWEYFSAKYIKDNFGIETTKELVQALTVAFCEQVKKHGYIAGFYSNKDYYDRFYGDEFRAAHPDYKFWYARPGYAQPDKDCDIWQYASDDGADYGYTGGNLDKNILMTGYSNVRVEPMKPLSEELIRMQLGPTDEVTFDKLSTKIDGLGIDVRRVGEHLVTGPASKGDQCYIMLDCNALGVAYKIYEEPKKESILVRIIKRILKALFGGE